MLNKFVLGMSVASVIAVSGVRTASAHVVGPILDYIASQYDASTGVWPNAVNPGTDDASQSFPPSQPTVITSDTANGSTALRFTSGTVLNINGGTGPNPTDFTILAFLRPDNGDSGHANVIGSNTLGGIQYFIEGGTLVQGLNAHNSAGLGNSATGLSLTDFSNISVTDSSSSNGSFRLNGNDDGTSIADTFTSGLDEIGNGFSGDIAEIQVYDSVLSDSDRAAIEANFLTQYQLTVPEPASLSILALGALSVCARRRKA